MNFFHHQDEARRQTTRLLVLFGLAIVGITLAVYAVFLVAAQASIGSGTAARTPTGMLWRPDLLAASAFGVGAVVGLATFVKTKSLGSGGAAVAESVGGRRVSPSTSDPQERRLLNVVEEMAIASGVPVPAVFILPHEKGINAFAAGFGVGDAAIAVTRGALHVLNRSELQAVVGHEFSHILNGDMRLNIRLIGVLFGLMMIGTTGGWLLRAGLGSGGRRRRNDGVPAIMAIGLALWLIGSIGVLFGRLIQRAISRQREFLADASSVQFTRDPTAMANALKKIGGYAPGTFVAAREASELSHMFFGEVLSGGFGSLLATHPPLEERIRRLDPSFDGRFAAVDVPDSLAAPPAPAPEAIAGLALGAAPVSMSLPGAAASYSMDPSLVVDHVGAPTQEHLAMGAAIVAAIPESLRASARNGLGAVALTYALLLDRDDDAQAARQRETLRATTHPDIFAEMTRLEPAVRALDPRARLPLVELAVAGLRQLSPDQYRAFRSEVAALTAVDGRLTLFEFAVHKSLLHWLDPTFGLRRRNPTQYYAIRALTEPLSVLLSALAYVGHESFDGAASAFQRGVARFHLLHPTDLRFLPPNACGFDRLDPALDKLSMATPAMKAQVLDACAHCVLADQTIDVDEAELLRVVADAFECPLPPFLPAAADASVRPAEYAAHAG